MNLDTSSVDSTNRSIEPVVRFCITNVILQNLDGSDLKLDEIDGTKRVRFTRNTGEENGKAYLLKNVYDKKSHYEADVVKPEDAAAVIQEALVDSGREEVLFFLHGWKNSCRESVNRCVVMNNMELDSKKKFLVLPIFWAAGWNDLQYSDERRVAAPEAGKDFRELYSTMADSLNDCTVKMSLLCHSMGNFVLRIFAQGHVELNGETKNPPVFEDIFMVAADVRWDLFNEEFNQGHTDEEDPNEKKKNLRHSGYTDGGHKIVNLAKNKVHVLYNYGDKALLGRQAWHRAGGSKVSAIGRCAGYAMDKLHPDFKDKVVFHHCNYMTGYISSGHSYFPTKLAMQYVEKPNPNNEKEEAWYFTSD